MLMPPSLRRERILVYGSWGAGKTTAWLSIALWAQRTGSPSRFYVLDSDNALEAMLDGPIFGSLTNLQHRSIYEWPDFVEATNRFSQVMTADDWLVVDFATHAWEAVQEWYVTEIFKAEMADYFLEMRKLNKGDKALDGWKDYSVINMNYKRWMNTILHKTPGHKFFTAKVDRIGDKDDQSTRAQYSAVGLKPKGQKDLGHVPHTVLLLQSLRPDEVYATTVKDRERAPVEGVKVTDFCVDYLVNRAGWTL